MNKSLVKRELRNAAEVLVIYALTTLLAYVFDIYSVHSENLLMIYLLGILIIIMQTKSFLATVFSSVLFVLTHDFLFLDPRYVWVSFTRNFAVTASVFLIVALIVNLLVVRLQKQIESSRESANLHKKLYKASQGLLAVHGRDNVIKYSDEALTQLAEAEVEFYFDIDKHDENEAKKWCFKNSAKCGHGEVEFTAASHKYLPIRSDNKTVGVVSIDCSKKEMSEETESCINALLSQIIIAIERESLETEKRDEEALREREQIKAKVMKGISHDMYPHVKKINETATKVKEGKNLMEDAEIEENLKSIIDDSKYLAEVVDNLIDITKDK